MVNRRFRFNSPNTRLFFGLIVCILIELLMELLMEFHVGNLFQNWRQKRRKVYPEIPQGYTFFSLPSSLLEMSAENFRGAGSNRFAKYFRMVPDLPEGLSQLALFGSAPVI